MTLQKNQNLANNLQHQNRRAGFIPIHLFFFFFFVFPCFRREASFYCCVFRVLLCESPCDWSVLLRSTAMVATGAPRKAEGFRLEGFDGQTPVLLSMDPLLDIGGEEGQPGFAVWVTFV